MSDQPLRWGILGTGGIVRRFLPGFRASGLTVVIVGSRDSERARAAAAEFGAERAGSYDDVFDAADVDVIYNALPNALVESTLRAAAAAGLPLREAARADRRGLPADGRRGQRHRRGVHVPLPPALGARAPSSSSRAGSARCASCAPPSASR